MAQLQDIWNKFNPRERLSTIGAGLIILGWIVGLTTLYGVGSSAISLLGAIAVIVIFYLKYTNTSITWPAPVSLIVLAISGIVGVLELLHLLQWLPYIGVSGASLLIVALGLSVVGAAIMLWGAWQEYQIVKPVMPNFGATPPAANPPAATPPAATAPPAAPEPPAADPYAPPADNTDEAPPV
jgi:hypothetical protein